MKKIINYSGIPVLVLIAALVFMPFSCSKEAVKENPLTDNSSQLIKISGEDANAATKTILVNFATLWIGGTDKVGVYCPEAQNENGRENIPYTASSTAFSSAFSGAMTWGTGTHDFYAYYPYAGTAGSPAATVVPISLSDAQTQSAGNSSSHLSALDFLVATPVSKAPGGAGVATSVNLRYNHLFTVLEFQIKGSGTLKSVKLTVPTNPIAFSGGTIDITQAPVSETAYTLASLTGTATQCVVMLTNAAALSTTTATTVYMVINPGTQTGNCTIGLSSDGTTWTNISKAAPVGGFLRGKKYVVTIEKDQDGNFFSIVTIGTQVWMASNLNTTKYNDGTAITNITGDNAAWAALSTGAYCDYDNTPSNSTTYGALYNWFAVNTGKLCPTGWHVPTDAEWTTLTTYLTNNGFGYGGSGNGIAKSMAGTSGWTAYGTAGTPGNDQTSNNTSGFTALPSGQRYYGDGTFWHIGTNGYWWSSTETNTTWSRGVGVYFSYSTVARFDIEKVSGYSVRCVKGETAPYLSTTAVSAIASNSAISGGEITSDGGSSVTARGVCWSTAQNPTTSNTKTTNGSGIGSFTSLMSGLTPGTTYYVRAYATNSIGTTYGTQRNFTTGNTVSDNDGNTYNTVTIGTQVWMAENLKTTKYNDGSDIPNVMDNTAWGANTAGAYCWYDNNANTYKATYGALYNWHAVNTGKLCPTGWHVPTDTEWTTLTTYLGGETVAGGKLKETGTTWDTPNTAATNSSGFTALPGGDRYNDGTFEYIGRYGYWWSSTGNGTGTALYRGITWLYGNANRYSFIDYRAYGFSVRCVRD